MNSKYICVSLLHVDYAWPISVYMCSDNTIVFHKLLTGLHNALMGMCYFICVGYRCSKRPSSSSGSRELDMQ